MTNRNGQQDTATIATDVRAADRQDPFQGRRIRELRKLRAMTLVQLAERTDLSPGYLSQIERGLSYPSINALINIASALGVTVQWFFNGEPDVPPEERDYVVRKRNRMEIRFDNGVIDELLTPKSNGHLEVLRSCYPPHTESAESYSHKGFEAVVVTTGRMEFWIGERHFVLDEGDSVAFSSGEPHRYRNPTDHNSEVFWIITPPTF